MARLRVMNERGDATVVWDPAKVASKDPEALAAVIEAERIFASNLAIGGTAFTSEGVRLDAFDPTVERETIVVPRMCGG